MFPSDFNEATIVWAILFIGIILLCIGLWKHLIAAYFIAAGNFAVIGLYIIVLPTSTMVTNIVGTLLIFMALVSAMMPAMTKEHAKTEAEKTYTDYLGERIESMEKARGRFKKARRGIW
jgi:membrane protein implicated in regulation of membrane protease activity